VASYEKIKKDVSTVEPSQLSDTSDFNTTTSLYYSPSDYSTCSSEQNLDTINISRWHSTKLDDECCFVDQTNTSSFKQQSVDEHKQLSSTIREQADRLIKKGYYNAPLDSKNYTVISHKPSYLQMPSQIDHDTTASTYDYCSTCDASSIEYSETSPEEFYTIYNEQSQYSSEEDTTVFPSSLVTNSINSDASSSNDSFSTTATQDSLNYELDTHYSSDYYVCILDYKPKLEGDIAIKYSDKVKVINSGSSLTNNNYVFVQLLKNGKYGYAPKKCFIGLAQFLNL
jgi:hypothetical protein